MTLEQKLVIAAVIRGLPYVVIIVSAGIYSVKRRSIVGALLVIGCAGIAAKDIWFIFAPIWTRTQTAVEYSRITLPLSICSVIGLYVFSIALAMLLMLKEKKSDNKVLEDSAAAQGSH